MKGPTVAEADTLDIGYNRRADRVALTLRGDEAVVRLWVTRRLLKGLLGQFAEMLEHTVDAAADHQRAAVVFEHLEALPDSGLETARADVDSESGGESGGGADKPPPDSEGLLQQVDIHRQHGQFEVSLQDDRGEAHNFPLSRAQAHRLLSGLYRKAAQAGWDLDGHAAWLSESGPAGAHGMVRASVGPSH